MIGSSNSPFHDRLWFWIWICVDIIWSIDMDTFSGWSASRSREKSDGFYQIAAENATSKKSRRETKAINLISAENTQKNRYFFNAVWLVSYPNALIKPSLPFWSMYKRHASYSWFTIAFIGHVLMNGNSPFHSSQWLKSVVHKCWLLYIGLFFLYVILADCNCQHWRYYFRPYCGCWK